MKSKPSPYIQALIKRSIWYRPPPWHKMTIEEKAEVFEKPLRQGIMTANVLDSIFIYNDKFPAKDDSI